jgi:thioredoxin 1
MKVLKFSASWCQPCKLLQAVIDNMSADIGIDIESIDIEVATDTANQYNIRGVPTLVLIDDVGNEVKRHVGMITREKLLEWLK